MFKIFVRQNGKWVKVKGDPNQTVGELMSKAGRRRK